MAITKNPTAPEVQCPYTVTRAFYWAGDVQAIGTVLQLTKAQAAELLNANKLTPGEPAADKPAAHEHAADKPAAHEHAGKHHGKKDA